MGVPCASGGSGRENGERRKGDVGGEEDDGVRWENRRKRRENMRMRLDVDSRLEGIRNGSREIRQCLRERHVLLVHAWRAQEFLEGSCLVRY